MEIIAYYDNSGETENMKVVECLPEDKKRDQSENFKKIKKPVNGSKEKKFTSTKDSLKEARKECQRNLFKRYPDQNNLMGGSANPYVQSTGLFGEDEKYQWLHEEPVSQSGNKKCQVEDNIFAGSKSLNDVMGILEDDGKFS